MAQTQISKFCWLFAVVIFGLFAHATDLSSTAPTTANPNSKKNQLEELFIWKISEELKLSAVDEKKFSEALKKLNLQKQVLSQELEELTAGLINAKTDPERKIKFKSYRKALLSYNTLAVTEVDQMQSIFGIQKLAKYMEIKMDLTNKVKSLLLNADKTQQEKKPLPSPQVIEE